MKFGTMLLLILSFVLIGCSGDEVVRAAVEKDFHASLSIGDPAEKIERVLREKGHPVVFNRFDGRYETGIDPKEKRSVRRVVRVLIYLDTSSRLSRIDVRNTYTYL